MSRFEECVKLQAKDGNISRDHARQVLEDFRNAKARGLDDVTAATKASADDLIRAEAGKVRTAQQIIKQTAAMENAAGHKMGARAGGRAVMSYDPWGMAGHESVEGAQRAMRGVLEAKFADGIASLKSKTLGLTDDTISARAFVREFYGETTGNPMAVAAAKSWKDADAYGLAMRRAEGSHIADTLPDYLPQAQNPARLDRMGKPAYVDAMMGRFDVGGLKMFDFETGLPLDRVRARRIVEDAYDAITTGGMNRLEPGQRGAKMLANAHSERRVFHWASADDWLWAAQEFGYGEGQIFESLMGHIRDVAREYGLLRIMGPNPDSTARAIVDQAEKEGARMLGGFVGTRHHLESVFDQVTGRAQSPTNEVMARIGRGVADWLRAAQLGSATLSAVGDFATLTKTADWLGLSKTKVISRYLELMNPSAVGAREQIIRTGLGAENVSRTASMNFRDGLAFGTAGLAAKFSDTVMKVSLLAPHTAAARGALGWEVLSRLAYLAKQDRAFNNLPGEMARAFERHGISEADWTLIKAAGVRDIGGVSVIHPETLARSAEGEGVNATMRLMAMINREMDMAAPIGGAFERALLQGKSRPGGIAFEFLVRPFAMYKSYPLSVITHHGFRMASTFLEEGFGPGMAYASLAVTMTAVGALAIQAKQLANGKDPRNMKDPNFWGAAFFQGGGAGIFGDFLNASLNRADRGLWMSLAGPQLGLVDDFARATGFNLSELAREKDTHAGREAANMLRRYTPGTSLWYTRLSLDRLLWDVVQKELDPDYPAAFRRIEQRARKEFSQEFWWSPGSSAPSRGPNLEAAFKTR